MFTESQANGPETRALGDNSILNLAEWAREISTSQDAVNAVDGETAASESVCGLNRTGDADDRVVFFP